MQLLVIAIVLLCSQLAVYTAAQIVRCEQNGGLCVDGRNRRDVSSETADVVPDTGLTVDTETSTEPEQTTVTENIPDDNHNMTETITISTTPEIISETPTTTIPEEPEEPESAIIFPVELKSEDFPKPFPAKYQRVWNIDIKNENGSAIDIIINELDVDPETDYLFIRAGNENTTEEKGQMLTGLLDKPQKYRIMQTQAFIQFESTKSKDQRYKGFSLIYMPYVKEQTTTEAPEETTPVGPEFDPDSLTVILVLHEANKTLETWSLFKNLLVISVNQYVGINQMGLELANSSNIFTSMQNCPDSWFNYESCIKFRFAVPLKPFEVNHSTSLEEMLSGHDEEEYQLNADNLRNMWEEFGRDAFLASGYHEYTIPDTDYLILIWSGIGLAIIFVFLIVLYIIWKMDILRDYHLMTSRADDQKNILSNQSEIDITMFPSPHQIVPTLFPSNSDPIQRMYDEAQPIRFSRSDFPQHRVERSTSQRSDHVRHDGFTTIPESLVENRLDMNQLYGDEEVAFERRPRTSQSPGIKQRIHLRGLNQQESMT